MQFIHYSSSKNTRYDLLMECLPQEMPSLINTYGNDRTYGQLINDHYWFMLDTKKKTITPVNEPGDISDNITDVKETEIPFNKKDYAFEQYSDYEKKNNLTYRMDSSDTAQYLTPRA